MGIEKQTSISEEASRDTQPVCEHCNAPISRKITKIYGQVIWVDADGLSVGDDHYHEPGMRERYDFSNGVRGKYAPGPSLPTEAVHKKVVDALKKGRDDTRAVRKELSGNDPWACVDCGRPQHFCICHAALGTEARVPEDWKAALKWIDLIISWVNGRYTLEPDAVRTAACNAKEAIQLAARASIQDGKESK